MKVSEALYVLTLIAERWPRQALDVDAARRYAEDIGDLDAARTVAALDVWHRSRAFPPSAGELRREVAALELDAPDWGEVKRSLIERFVRMREHEPSEWSCPLGRCDGSGIVEVEPPEGSGGAWAARCGCYADRVAARRMAESLHPMVREFITGGFVTWAEVEAVGEGAGTREATTLEAQMRTKWEAFVARAVLARSVAGLEGAADLPALERSAEEDRRRRPSLARRALRRLAP